MDVDGSGCWRSASGAGACDACLASGVALRAVPTCQALLALLLELPEECSLLVCWQCEAAILNVQRFRNVVRDSQRILHKFWAECHISAEAAKPVLVTPDGLSCSELVVTVTPGEVETVAARGRVRTTLLTPNLDADRWIPFSVLTAETPSEERAPRSRCLALEHRSDQSDDEALSSVRRKKIESERCAGAGGMRRNAEEKGRRKPKRKGNNRSLKNLKEVSVDDDEGNSDAGSVRDGDCRTEETIAGKARGRQNEKFKKVSISEEAMLAGRELERTSKWYVQASHRCTTCLIGYYSEEQLREHVRLKHDQANAFACPVCAVRLPDERRLARHAALHRRRLECRACGERQRTYRDMWRHHASRHEPGRSFLCAQCPRVFQTRPSLVYHRRCDHRERAKCEQCGNTFRNQTTYKRHLLIHTGMPTYECKICKRSYRGKFGYRTHMKTHGPPPGDAYCVECDVQFKHGFQYRRHLKISPRHAAGAPAPDAGPLAKKHPCSACEKRFVSPSVLKRHFDSVHLKLKRYGCDKCDKNYATPAALWTHRKMQHERVVPPRDKVCEVCGKGFRSNTTLVDHMRSHTGERPFSCDACAATFRHNSGLYMHKRLIHRMGKKRTGPKDAAAAANVRTDLPFRCKLCPATFRHTSGLYMHNRLVHKNGMKKNERAAEEHDPGLYAGIELLM